MGKKYNWKARQVVETIIDNSTTKKIKLDLIANGKYDDSNQLVLPSEKRKTKIKKNTQTVSRILSKKQRKTLEKIVEKKKKKQNRTSLLEALCQVQATPEELKNLTSIASVQSKGLKRYLNEKTEGNEKKKKLKKIVETTEIVPNSIKGAKKHKIETNIEIHDPNVVGFDNSDESDEESTDNRDNTVNIDVNHEITLNEGVKMEDVETIEDDDTTTIIEDTKNEKESNNMADDKSSVTNIAKKPAVFVDVYRDSEIQTARLKLPILAEEQPIIETINLNDIVIITGETGSGKTTQLPQFLYEAGYALERQIAVTEPRRVAAIAMSQRVAHEMSLTSKQVSYLIRFEGNVGPETKIRFMTDGVLLKEVQNDFLLKNYSVVILDEAHERSVYTDILIGLLSRIVRLRKKRDDPLKLIVMSATLRLDDFAENQRLFSVAPPVIKVDTRQYPVTVHFNRRTVDDYLNEAYKKVVKIHKQLPEGGILVFLTGQQEVNDLVRRLRRTFPIKTKSSRTFKKKFVEIKRIDLDDYEVADAEASEGSDDESDVEIADESAPPMWTLPLYSLLPTEEQQKVFAPSPEGTRLCVISTNVAETSLTIPHIKYVVDCGRSKVRMYDKVTGVSTYVVTWTSKASANQRAGRAGRQGAGHCYRLYSSAIYNDIFPEYDTPEIQKKPVDDLYLQMKCMGIDKIVNFPFPTAPDLLQLKTAEKRLEILEILKNGEVTALGKAVVKFPVLPRYGKMLALSHQFELLPYTVALVAALSVQEVLLETPVAPRNLEEIKVARQKWAVRRRKWVSNTTNSLLLGDAMVLLKAVGGAEYANTNQKLVEFCTDFGVREKGIIEIRKLRKQITDEIRANMPDIDLSVDPKLAPPTDLQAKLLRQILLAGSGDRIARHAHLPEDKYAYYANDMADPVYLLPSSVLRRHAPEYVIYQEIYEGKKMYMRGITAIESDWLPIYVKTLCNLSEPLKQPSPYYDESDGRIKCTANGTFGRQAWPLGHVIIPHPINTDLYRMFAKHFLEGCVFKKLSEYVKVLLAPPGVMEKSWSSLHPRTDAFLKRLITKEVTNKNRLVEIWEEEEPKYLLEEYLKWLPESAHCDVRLKWPPLD